METEQLEYWSFQNQFPYPGVPADHSPDLSPASSLNTSPSFSDCEVYPQYAHYNPMTTMPEEYSIRYQFPLTPGNLSASPVQTPYLTPAPSYIEPARPSVSQRQHVTSGRRRAQNRAAQRAFRERKEKHARDLELKLNEMSEKYRNLEITHSELRIAYDKLHKTLDLLLVHDVKDEDEDGQGEVDGEGGGGGGLPSNAETLRKLLMLLHGEITQKGRVDSRS